MDEEIKVNGFRNRNKVVDGKRQCSKCKTYKDLDEFSLSRDSSRGKTFYRAECKECVNIRSKTYQAKNREAVLLQKRDSALRDSYGIGVEEFNILLASQGGGCKICGATEANSGGKRYTNLAVDHNHETGKVRGLLCNKHNRGLGMFGDSIEMLELAIQYLKDND